MLYRGQIAKLKRIHTWHDEAATFFVRVVGAILVTVAQSRERNASARVETTEFGALDATFARFRTVAILFILSLGAIRFFVANPRLPNAITCINQIINDDANHEKKNKRKIVNVKELKELPLLHWK